MIRHKGIDWAKIICSFLVVLNHFGYNEKLGFILASAVPIFVMISFYVSNPREYTKYKLKKRVSSLLIALYGWGLVYYIILSLISPLPLCELAKHFFWGYSRNLAPPFYYLADMVIIIGIIYITRQFNIRILWGIVVCCFIFQYSGWNMKLLESVIIEEARITWGRIFELFPYAVIGVVCKEGMYKVNKLKNVMILIIVLMGILYDPNKNIGFGYQGLILFIGAGTIFLMIISFETKSSLKVEKIAKYSMGIYGAHWGVGRLIEIFYLPRVDFYLEWCSSIMIWIFSLGISILMAKIHLKKLVL